MKSKLTKILYRVDEYLAYICVVSLVIITLWGVFMRYFMNDPIKWLEEVSLGLFVWFIFLGSSVAVKQNMHVSVTYIVDLFPKKMQRIIDILITILTYIILITLLILGIQFAKQAMIKITPVLRLPYTVIAMALPVGCLLMIIHMTIRQIKSRFGLINIDGDDEL